MKRRRKPKKLEPKNKVNTKNIISFGFGGVHDKTPKPPSTANIPKTPLVELINDMANEIKDLQKKGDD